MLILSLTTDKISLITSSTADVDVVSNFIDRNQSTGVVGLAERQLATINTATTTDIVAVPGATTTRNVKSISVRNRHATSSNDVTVQFNANGTLYTLFKVTLLAGETLLYIDQVGFYKVSDSTRLLRTFIMTADSVHATAATLATITGLSCPGLKANVRYNFMAMLMYSTDASTTGAQFAVNLGTAPTSLEVTQLGTVTSNPNASAHSTGRATVRDTVIAVSTSGPGTNVVPAIITGYVIPSVNDALDMRATSEVTVANGLVIKAGSWLKVWQPN